MPRKFLHRRLLSCVLALLALTSCKIGMAPRGVTMEEKEYDVASGSLAQINDLNERGRYAEAVPLAARLLETVKKRNSPDHPAVASCLNMLGGLYVSMGDYGKALPILEQGLAVMEKSSSADSPAAATGLGLTAKAYVGLGELAKAEPLAARALTIRRAKLAQDSLALSTSLHSLGDILMRSGRLAEAEPLLVEAMAIRERQGNLHGLALTLTDLCLLYLRMNDLNAAELAGETARNCARQALDGDHPHIAAALMALGRVKAAMGKKQDAFELMHEAQLIQLSLIDQLKGFASEEQKLAFLAHMEGDYHTYLQHVAKNMAFSTQARNDAATIVLRRKGVVLEVQKVFQEAVLAGDTQTRALFDELSRVRSTLAGYALSSGDDSTDSQALYRSLKQRAHDIELRLASVSRGYQESRRKGQADASSVNASLPVSTLLVEIVRITPSVEYGPTRLGLDRYVAFVLGKGRDVALLDLGPAEEVDLAARQFLKSMQPDRRKEGEAGYKNACAKLHALVFAPLEKVVPPSVEVYISPDSSLNLVPFEVMASPDGRFLVERNSFIYLTSGRELLAMGEQNAPSGRPLLMGDPDYDLDQARSVAKAGLRKRAVEMETLAEYRQVADLWFSPLPGTRLEVKAIQELLGTDKCEMLLGAQATEEALLARKAPEFLHLATHGFVLAGTSPSMVATGDGTPGFQTGPPNREPLLTRSGLALSGANGEESRGGKSRGILTAEKVLALDLKGTRLVVLSACNSGTGGVISGEGVFGLRRAFAQAGAKSLVMSFWPVSDRDAAELMIEFYRNKVQEGLKSSEALRRAMLRQKETARTRHGSPDPFFWGAFILIGDPL